MMNSIGVLKLDPCTNKKVPQRSHQRSSLHKTSVKLSPFYGKEKNLEEVTLFSPFKVPVSLYYWLFLP